jgi:hypothetical protein
MKHEDIPTYRHVALSSIYFMQMWKQLILCVTVNAGLYIRIFIDSGLSVVITFPRPSCSLGGFAKYSPYNVPHFGSFSDVAAVMEHVSMFAGMLLIG